jgi:hypothetical protein
MADDDNRYEIASQDEVDEREREIQLLINVVEPDPEYQPWLLTDEATFSDAIGADEEVILDRLRNYFGEDLGISLRLPIWRFVDEVKKRRPGWPDEE